MSQLFNGNRARPVINLGGAVRNSQAELIEEARIRREERESNRLRDKAAVIVQAFYRGRSSAKQTKAAFRVQFDAIASSLNKGTIAVESRNQGILIITRLLTALFTIGNASDMKRAGNWCRLVLGPIEVGGKVPLLFGLLAVAEIQESWIVLIQSLSCKLLKNASVDTSSVQVPLILEIIKLLCDVNSYTKYKISPSSKVLEYLLSRSLYSCIRDLIIKIPAERRAHPALPSCVSLALLPFKFFPAPLASVSRSAAATPISPQRSSALDSFISDFLTIPLLPTRLSPSSLTNLSTMPVESIILHAAQPTFIYKKLVGSELELERVATLLSNISQLMSRKIATFGSGKVLASYMIFTQTLLDKLPQESLSFKAGEVKVLEDVIIIDDSDDEDGEMEVLEAAADLDDDSEMAPPTPILSLDSRTLESITYLVSTEHITTLLALSTRFSASTRPALASILVSLLTAFPSHREPILNTIMFSSTGGERGGGLLREIWRGYIRTGRLGKLLSGGDRSDRLGLVLKSLTNVSLGEEWPAFILLAELYSRCLLTLGDDEFHSSTKNPLSLDEVIGFSEMWRNLAFGLYWQEGSVADWNGTTVAGTRIRLEALRELATRLLQQVHARDSRKSFTPKNFWLMTSQFDLASFIQTVIYEDDANEDEADEDEHGAPRRRLIEEDGEEQRPLAHSKAKMSSRQQAFLGPRQGVLSNIPFVIPFESRVTLFRQMILNDRERLGIERHRYDRSRRHRAVIRRNHISEDSYAHLNALGPALKSTIEIVFIDQHGLEEKGIDGGGLFKELLTSLSKEAFDTDRGLWLATKEQELYPNPHSYAKESTQLGWYSFIGRILGKALYEGILVDVRFASFFLSKWLGRQSYLDDLSSLDPELYSGLMFLKNYVGDVEADLSLNFTVTDDEFGVQRSIDLIANGSEVPVTNTNRISYIYLTSNYRLNRQIEKQCQAFFAGLSEIIPARSLKMFNQDELRMLVGGVDQPVDLQDLQLNTVYGGFDGDEANDTIRDFWSVVESFDREERGKLVKFVTSCARPPLLGFSELNPRFAIRAAGNDETRLPTSSTCVNLLKLPQYQNKETLRTKLLYAITSGAGFDLS